MKTLVIKNLHYRVLAIACFLASVAIVNYFEAPDETPEALFVRPTPFQETTTENRDLSFYEFGGNVEDCSWTHSEQELTREQERQFIRDAKACSKNQERARQFLLHSWDAERQSYIIVDHYNHVFIEYMNGWRITIRSNNCIGWYPGFGKCMTQVAGNRLELRKATKGNDEHKIGESYLAVLDGENKEIFGF